MQHNWQDNFALYQSLTENSSPIFLGWKQGNLKIKAGNLSFQTTVTATRRVINAQP
jgi:hypothetical protein